MKHTTDFNDSNTDSLNNIQVTDIFNLEDLQRLQDLFADAHGVASIITDTEGTPITNPSNFCRLCNDIIRKTEKGRANCFKSDATIGKQNSSGSIVQPCLSGDLWDAGASITVGGKHIANWLIGQVRNEEVDEQRMIQYADEIGANRADFMEALNEVPVMSVVQFNKVAKLLFAFANELSEKAYNNWQLKKQIAEQEKATKLLQKNEERFQLLFNKAPLGYQSLDFDGNFIEVNQHWLDMLGYTREEVIGKWFGDFLSPAYQDGFRERFPIFKAQGKIHSEFEMVHKNGNKLFIAFEGKIGYDLNGEFKQTHCILQDITDRKQAEEALVKLKKAIYTSGEAIFLTDREGVFTFVNPAFTTLYGFSSDEIVGKTTPRIIKSGILDKSVYEIFWQTLLNGDEVRGEIINKSKDGTLINIENSATPVFDEEKNIIGFLGIQRDITERKQAEEALQINETLFRELFDNMKSGSAIFTVINDGSKGSDYIIKKINRIGLKMEEKALEEVVGKRFIDIRPTIDNYGLIPVMKKTWETGKSGILPVSIYIDEHYSNFYENYVFKLPSGEIVTLYDDITDRKQAEEALVKLKKAIYTSGEVIFLTDREGVFTFVNPAFTALYGYSSEEIVGKTTPRILKSELLDKSAYENFWLTLLDGKEVRGELVNLRKDGTLINVESSATPISDEEKNIIGFLGIQRNITERKLVEQELIIAKEHAEESDRLKSAFLANMSHEIRTPMNGILGFAELLKEPNLTGEEQQNYIRIIEKSGARMLNIISEIMDISKIESGQMNLSVSETNVNEQVENIYAFFKAEVELKGIHLSVKKNLSSSEAIIMTDREKLYSILTNLVKNAIKYTNKGSIEFGYNRVETLHATSLPDRSYLQFFVKDTGIGIPKDRQEAIFERFIQVDIIDKMARQGAGLGLSISKAYVEMLGGKIWVESKEGIGSTFYFTLPYIDEPGKKAIVKNGVPAIEAGNMVKKLKILIAEDDETSSELISIQVRKFGNEIIIVETGTEAVEVCRNNPDIDLILMDIQMPEMSGYEATRQIRQFNAEVLIIALTAFALAGDREKALKAGCNDYISKPSQRGELVGMIQKYFGKMKFHNM